jgi:hypothetical protein
MPASSLSSSISWAAYLVAALALVASMAPTLQAVSTYSQEAALGTIVHGLASFVNGLQPGMTSSLVLQVPSGSASVLLRGDAVVGSLGGFRVAQPTRWDLPNMSMAFGVIYSFRIAGGRVVIS